MQKKSSFCVVLMSFPNLLALLNTVYCFVYSVKEEKLERIRLYFVFILNCLSRVESNERYSSRIKSMRAFDRLLK